MKGLVFSRDKAYIASRDDRGGYMQVWLPFYNPSSYGFSYPTRTPPNTAPTPACLGLRVPSSSSPDSFVTHIFAG